MIRSSVWKASFGDVSGALADEFEEGNAGGDADVEAVGDAGHGEFGGAAGGLEPVVGEAFVFGAEGESGGGAEVFVPKLGGGVGGEADDLDIFFFEKEEGFDARGLNNGEVEEGALGGADSVGVVDIADGVAEDEGVGPGGVGRAHQGTEVARLLHALGDEEKGGRAEGEVFEGAGALGGYAEEAVRIFAVGGLGEDRLVHLNHFDRAIEGGVDEVHDVGPVKALRGEKEGAEPPAAGEGALDFPLPLNEETASPAAVAGIPQAHEVFDARVLQAGDKRGRRGGHGKSSRTKEDKNAAVDELFS